MKTLDVEVPIFNYSVRVYLLSNSMKDRQMLENIISSKDFRSLEQQTREDTLKIFDMGMVNCGRTFFDEEIMKADMFVFNHISTCCFCSTLSHEIYHISQDIMRRHDIDNEETQAYIIGYLSEQILPWAIKK